MREGLDAGGELGTRCGELPRAALLGVLELLLVDRVVFRPRTRLTLRATSHAIRPAVKPGERPPVVVVSHLLQPREPQHLREVVQVLRNVSAQLVSHASCTHRRLRDDRRRRCEDR